MTILKIPLSRDERDRKGEGNSSKNDEFVLIPNVFFFPHRNQNKIKYFPFRKCVFILRVSSPVNKFCPFNLHRKNV